MRTLALYQTQTIDDHEVRHIHEDRLYKIPDLFMETIETQSDIEPFYEALRITLISFKIHLIPYADITADGRIFVITPTNCHNYKKAHAKMSRCLYLVLSRNKEQFFPNNVYYQNILIQFQHDQNGCAYMLLIV